MNQLPFQSPIGRATVYYEEQLDSTMDRMWELIDRGAASGTVVVAGYQRSGRGRRPGRVWHSPPGMSLMFTVSLQITDPDVLCTASLRAGIAVSYALEELCAVRPSIKWPNDVLLDGRKVAGVLCDLRGEWLLIGTGINLHQDRFPAAIAGVATSIALAGGTAPDRDQLLLAILTHLRDLTIGPEEHERRDRFLSDLDHRLFRLGESVAFRVPDGTEVSGVLVGIDRSGRVRIRTDHGEQAILAGEMV
jgi:BirA family biotin operon repressor/biotin-[acetyl-CoA-carboxylase] ligase